MNYIDLFAGAGGLSEGFTRMGFTPIAHVEMNKDACDTLRTRAVFHWLRENGKENIYYNYLKSENRDKDFFWKENGVPQHVVDSVINKEISKETLSEIFELIDSILGDKNVDVVIGGPPCQAYSVAGRARKNMDGDPRNFLYQYYIKFLKKYRPKMFVFENVPGILSAKNGEYLDKIFEAVRNAGYELSLPTNSQKFLNSKNFGVLQDRKRVIIVGWRKELALSYPDFEITEPKFKILKDLFADLPELKNGEGTMNAVKYKKPTTEYLKQSKIRGEIDFVTQHIARPNNENDLEIYRMAVEEMNQGKRLNYATFTNRFQVVNGDGISHTVVAHIAMDGHYYIHPDIKQNRSITIREAARIQSFPDDYFFEGSRTAVFKQIGNAVPPLMAEKIARKIKEILKSIV